MCNFTAIARLVLQAQAFIVAMLAGLAIATINAGSFFLAAGNLLVIGVLVALCVASGLSYSAAMREAQNCATGPCGGFAAPLVSRLYAMALLMGGMAVLIAAMAIAAAVPYFGGAVVATFMQWVMVSYIAAIGVAGINFAHLASGLNSCLIATNPSASDAAAAAVLLAVAYAIGVVIVGGLSYGFEFGLIPTRLPNF